MTPARSEGRAAADRLGRTAVATPSGLALDGGPRRGIEQLHLGVDRGPLEVELAVGRLGRRSPLGPLAGDLLGDVALPGRPAAIPIAGHRLPPFLVAPLPRRPRPRRSRPAGSAASRSSSAGCPCRRPDRPPRPAWGCRRRRRRRPRPAPASRSCSSGWRPWTSRRGPRPRRRRPRRRAGSAAAPSRRARRSTGRGRSRPCAGSPIPIRSLATFSVPSSSITDRSPLCPPCEPPSRNRSLPNGSAKSSVTISRSASGTRSRASSLRTAMPGVVHVGQRLGQRELQAPIPDLDALGRVALAPATGLPRPVREPVEHHPADVVPRARVLAARIAQADDELHDAESTFVLTLFGRPGTPPGHGERPRDEVRRGSSPWYRMRLVGGAHVSRAACSRRRADRVRVAQSVPVARSRPHACHASIRRSIGRCRIGAAERATHGSDAPTSTRRLASAQARRSWRRAAAGHGRVVDGPRVRSSGRRAGACRRPGAADRRAARPGRP